MKTVQIGEKVVRVSDQEAERLVAQGGQYVAKKVWKALHPPEPKKKVEVKA